MINPDLFLLLILERCFGLELLISKSLPNEKRGKNVKIKVRKEGLQFLILDEIRVPSRAEDASGITGVEQGCGNSPCSAFNPLDSYIEILFASGGQRWNVISKTCSTMTLTYVTSSLLSPVRNQMQKLSVVPLKLKTNQGEPGISILVPNFYIL